MGTQYIPIDDLRPGMFMVALDRPWPEVPGFPTKHRIERPDDITRLKAYGVRRVCIDPTLGTDRADEPTISPQHGEKREAVRPSPATALPKHGSLAHEVARARAVLTETQTAVQSILEGVMTGATIDTAATREVVIRLLNTIMQRRETLVRLISIRQFDANLFTHSTNVCVLALLVGDAGGLSPAQLDRLGVGALLHDVGKTRLPRNLLRKGGVYTPRERTLMRTHPTLGATILAQSDAIHEESRRIAAEHHECCDGSGYPAGLRGSAIGPLSQIVGLAEVYEAMLSPRRGRPPLLPAQAIKAIYQRGTSGQVDLQWAEILVRCLGIYPVGSLVELSTGERGVVTAVHRADALRPSVTLLCDASRRPYATRRAVHLATPGAGEPARSIIGVLDPAREGYTIAPYLEDCD